MAVCSNLINVCVNYFDNSNIDGYNTIISIHVFLSQTKSKKSFVHIHILSEKLSLHTSIETKSIASKNKSAHEKNKKTVNIEHLLRS